MISWLPVGPADYELPCLVRELSDAGSGSRTSDACLGATTDQVEGLRFTQEDPIGLAGGMNLYGYADGDPINNSDPYGLWAVAAVQALIVLASPQAREGLLRAVNVAVGFVSAAVSGASVSSGTSAGYPGSPSSAAAADAAAVNYRPGGRFSGRTKEQIDRDATSATGQEGTCEFCGITLVPAPGSPNSTEYDHQNPRSKGGDNSPGNGRRSCRTCNRENGAKDKPDPRAKKEPSAPQP